MIENAHFLRKCYHWLCKKRDFIKDYWYPITLWKLKNKNGAFLVLTPAHRNLGDHAIAVSEKEFLKHLGYEIYEITGERLFFLEKIKKLSIMNRRTIFFHGGGYLGTIWYHNERVFRNVIISCPDSKILMLPNTVYYEDSECGREEFYKAEKIYSSHKHLTLCAREKKSFAIMKELCNNVILAPDMVMILKRDDDQPERKGVLLCLRSDLEKTLTNEQKLTVMEQAESLFTSVETTDTVIAHGIPVADRTAELEKIFLKFKSAELVITDRLHGMIFCAVTGTPCIVLNSKSHKVRGCYEWLKHLPYIRICDDVDEISELYNQMPHGGQRYDNTRILDEYKDLISALKAIGAENAG